MTFDVFLENLQREPNSGMQFLSNTIKNMLRNKRETSPRKRWFILQFNIFTGRKVDQLMRQKLQEIFFYENM